MKVRFALFLTALAALPMLANAQSATGKWMGERAGRGGGEPQKIVVVLNADGTGTYQQGDREAETLSDVKIEGNMVSFKRMRNFGARGGGGGGGAVTMIYSGQMDGKTLTLEISREGGDGGGGNFGGGGRGGQRAPLVLTKE